MTGAYSYQIGGPPVPADVTNFVVNQVGENVIMQWDNLTDPGTTGFDLLYGPQGEDIGQATMLTEVTRATEITTAKVPPGSYTFWIRARDIADQPSETPTSYDFVVVNNNTVLSQTVFVPAYSDQGVLGGFGLYRHWTGALVPIGNFTSNHYSQLSPPDETLLQLDQVAGGTFDATTYYFQITFVTAGGETLPSIEVSINVDAGFLPTAFFAVTDFPSASIEGWNVYVSTSSGAETQQNTATLSVVPPPNPSNIVNPIDQIWQMPATGLIAGNALPTSNTTGWEVFDVFVPDPYGFPSLFVFSPDFGSDIDTGVQANKRVWYTVQLVPGPGQGDPESGSAILSQPINKMLETYASGSSTPPFNLNAYDNYFTIGVIEDRYLRAGFEFIPKKDHVFYISAAQITVDNQPATTALQNVAVSSAGTTINYADYGLAYHQVPAIQITPASSAATSGNAIPASTSAALTLYNGSTPITGVANIAITGV